MTTLRMRIGAMALILQIWFISTSAARADDAIPVAEVASELVLSDAQLWGIFRKSGETMDVAYAPPFPSPSLRKARAVVVQKMSFARYIGGAAQGCRRYHRGYKDAQARITVDSLERLLDTLDRQFRELVPDSAGGSDEEASGDDRVLGSMTELYHRQVDFLDNVIKRYIDPRPLPTGLWVPYPTDLVSQHDGATQLLERVNVYERDVLTSHTGRYRMLVAQRAITELSELTAEVVQGSFDHGPALDEVTRRVKRKIDLIGDQDDQASGWRALRAVLAPVYETAQQAIVVAFEASLHDEAYNQRRIDALDDAGRLILRHASFTEIFTSIADALAVPRVSDSPEPSPQASPELSEADNHLPQPAALPPLMAPRPAPIAGLMRPRGLDAAAKIRVTDVELAASPNNPERLVGSFKIRKNKYTSRTIIGRLFYHRQTGALSIRRDRNRTRTRGRKVYVLEPYWHADGALKTYEDMAESIAELGDLRVGSNRGQAGNELRNERSLANYIRLYTSLVGQFGVDPERERVQRVRLADLERQQHGGSRRRHRRRHRPRGWQHELSPSEIRPFVTERVPRRLISETQIHQGDLLPQQDDLSYEWVRVPARTPHWKWHPMRIRVSASRGDYATSVSLAHPDHYLLRSELEAVAGVHLHRVLANLAETSIGVEQGPTTEVDWARILSPLVVDLEGPTSDLLGELDTALRNSPLGLELFEADRHRAAELFVELAVPFVRACVEELFERVVIEDVAIVKPFMLVEEEIARIPLNLSDYLGLVHTAKAGLLRSPLATLDEQVEQRWLPVMGRVAAEILRAGEQYAVADAIGEATSHAFTEYVGPFEAAALPEIEALAVRIVDPLCVEGAGISTMQKDALVDALRRAILEALRAGLDRYVRSACAWVIPTVNMIWENADGGLQSTVSEEYQRLQLKAAKVRAAASTTAVSQRSTSP